MHFKIYIDDDLALPGVLFKSPCVEKAEADPASELWGRFQ